MKVLTIKTPNESYEIHLLNVGEMFPPDWEPGKHNGFGWSNHPLRAGYDYNTDERQKKPTASIVVRRRSAQDSEDTERDITDPYVWQFICRAINGGVEDGTAELGEEIVAKLLPTGGVEPK
jgi:hypothetical protein